MTPEQFREMRVRLVNTLQKPWHEIDAILNDYAPPWPVGEQMVCGCGTYTFTPKMNAITVDGVLHTPGYPCEATA